MIYNSKLIETLQRLEIKGYEFTEKFLDDLHKILKNDNDIENFAKVFYRDVIRLPETNNNQYAGKFEVLRLQKNLNRRLNNNFLLRYEYRTKTNLRCIFVREIVDNKCRYTFLCAFNEDRSRKKGANSYNDNIEKAIRIFEGL